MADIFEQASRMKLRFSHRGLISYEDLWDLSVQELDKIFQTLNAKLKAEKEESLLGPKDRATSELELQVAVLRHIVGVKLSEATEREQVAVKAKMREKIIDALAKKEDQVLEEKSPEELREMLDEL